MRGDSSVAGEGGVVGVPKFHSWGLVHHAINEYQLSLDVQCFLWPVYYIILPGSFISWVLYFVGPLFRGSFISWVLYFVGP